MTSESLIEEASHKSSPYAYHQNPQGESDTEDFNFGEGCGQHNNYYNPPTPPTPIYESEKSRGTFMVKPKLLVNNQFDPNCVEMRCNSFA